MATSIVEHENVPVDSHDHEHVIIRTQLTRFTIDEIFQNPNIDCFHDATTCNFASADVTSLSTKSASSPGNVASIS